MHSFANFKKNVKYLNENNIFLDEKLKEKWNKLSFSYKLTIFNKIFFLNTDDEFNDLYYVDPEVINSENKKQGELSKLSGGAPPLESLSKINLGPLNINNLPPSPPTAPAPLAAAPPSAAPPPAAPPAPSAATVTQTSIPPTAYVQSNINSFIKKKAELEREASELNKEIVSIKREISTARNEQSIPDSNHKALLNELEFRETTDPLKETLIFKQKELDKIIIQQLKEIDEFLKNNPPDSRSTNKIIKDYYKHNNLIGFKNNLLEQLNFNKNNAIILLSNELERGDGKVPNIEQI